jgi:hypothetical protein
VANFIEQNLTVFKFSQTCIKKFYNSNDSKSVSIFSLLLVIFELLSISRFYTKQKFQNTFKTHAAACRQKVAADFVLNGRGFVSKFCEYQPRLAIFNFYHFPSHFEEIGLTENSSGIGHFLGPML